MTFNESMSFIVINVIAFLIIWFIIGCIIMAIVDKKGEILKWAYEDSPNSFYGFLVTMLFPLFIYIYFKNKYKN